MAHVRKMRLGSRLVLAVAALGSDFLPSLYLRMAAAWVKINTVPLCIVLGNNAAHYMLRKDL